MDDLAAMVENVPDSFRRFIAAPPHRLFGIFGDLAGGREAVAQLRGEGGFAHEDDIWVLFGEEGSRRLDLSGAEHGVGARVLRFFQQQLSGDVSYLKTLDEALRGGHMVIAVLVSHEDIDQVTAVLRHHGAYSLARVAHWDLVPIPS